MGALYAIEETIRGKLPQERLRVRLEQAWPLLEVMEVWLRASVTTLSRKSDTAAAILYALNRWQALMRYCDDGVIEINNSAAERALRGVALGRTASNTSLGGCFSLSRKPRQATPSHHEGL